MKRFGLLIPFSLLLAACQPNTDKALNTSAQADSDKPSQQTVSTSDFSAHWLTIDLIILASSNNETTYHLVNGDTEDSVVLNAVKMPDWVIKKHPHLSSFTAYNLSITSEKAKSWLKQPLYVQATGNINSHKAHVQMGEILDSIYTSGENDADEEKALGASLTDDGVVFKLWAPTARSVDVLLFDENKQALEPAKLALVEDTNTGTWYGEIKHSKANRNLAFQYYQYQIRVFHPATQKIENITTTDPYSLSLSTNSVYSQIVDLDDPATQPKQWTNHTVPALVKPEDAILYETHIRDFSAIERKLSDEGFRGKYKAFTEKNTDGINHIKSLKAAGLNHIHLLPAFDIGTVNEERAIDLNSSIKEVCELAPETSICDQAFDPSSTLLSVLSSFDPITGDAQALITELKTFDKYNWGYDPFHYTVPEGSYATDPDGIARVIEFREMVQSLHQLGFRVVMDVVYNHTHQARMERTAVLDKIVPNYYQRLNPLSGDIEQSTCCDNTATERKMMAKLMNDSLVVWARDYKIDGFRFDLMGHQPKDAMLKARELVRAVDPDTYFYGEGWNFGEVANNKQFVQASQLELAGTEIGTFTDRLRDAIRGPGISVQGNDIRRNQGIGNGLVTRPNELNQGSAENAPDYYLLMDQARIGLAGNLANFPIEDRFGHQVIGKDIPYGDQPAGYALDPADTINYISKHDNQTLWDNNQYRNAHDLTTDERVRLHNQSLSFALLAQGIPFIHMGSELLRSKSYLRDSYDYSDWFNRVDFSKESNFYNVGLPPAEKDQANWPLISSLLERNQGRDIVGFQDIEFASNVFKEFLKIRASNSLFSLSNADEIIKQMSFLNTGKDQKVGLIVMRIETNKASVNSDIKTQHDEIVVVFNTAAATQEFTTTIANGFALHPVQKNGVDAQTKLSKVTNSGFKVPAFTTAVFVKRKQ